MSFLPLRGLASALLLPPLLSAAPAVSPRATLLVADRPATRCLAEAYPIGNGRLGAMIFGGTDHDRIQFNEDSLWIGDTVSTMAFKYDSDRKGIIGAYQDFGDVLVDFEGVKDAGAASAASGYRRELNLSTARCTTDFVRNGVRFTREAFASAADGVIVVRYRADKPGAHSGRIRLADAHGHPTTAKAGVLAAGGGFSNGMTFESRVVALHEGGTLEDSGDGLVFKDCDTLTLVIAARTNYLADAGKNWIGIAPSEKLDADLKAAAKPYDVLKAESEKAHRPLMERASIDIGTTPPALLAQTTVARLKAYRAGGADPDLEEDLFNFGRYLLVCSSRGALPANLQGLWNDSNAPAWAGDYHNNLNIQMNYWGAEVTGLPEMHTPLFDYVIAQKSSLRKAVLADTAEFANPVRGWTARTSQNPFGGTSWEWHQPASAWYMLHFWEHYAFTGDRAFLKDVAYPEMRQVCEFWEDRLKPLTADGANFVTSDTRADRSSLKGIVAGTLVAPHGWSPEQGPKEDGVSYDDQLVWDLFSNTAEAAKLLGDDAYAAKLLGLRARLAPPRIGRWGQLQEWMIDRDDPKNEHRVISSIFGLYPGHQFSLEKTPALAAASRVILMARSGEKPGEPFSLDDIPRDGRVTWVWPWRCAYRARLGEGERAAMMIRGGFRSVGDNLLMKFGSIFQIDGNLGTPGAIAEMLLQSQEGEIHLLPAVPKAWAAGSFAGLRARGGFVVDLTWSEGAVTGITLRSLAGAPARIRLNHTPLVTDGTGASVPVSYEGGVATFATKSGETYRIKP